MRRDPIYTARAREMRSNETAAEARLWSVLRAKKLGGFKFRRQHALGNYIADFVCLRARLVIEVDGATHGENVERRDEQRTAYLKRLGYRVIRFWNTDVFESLDDVAGAIAYELGLHDPPTPPTVPDPSP